MLLAVVLSMHMFNCIAAVVFSPLLYIAAVVFSPLLCTLAGSCLLSALSHCHAWLVLTGDRLEDIELEEILKFTHTEEDLDGNIKYGGEQIVGHRPQEVIFEQ